MIRPAFKRLAFSLAAVLLLTAPAGAAELPNGVRVMLAGELEKNCVIAAVLAESQGFPASPDERLAGNLCAGYFAGVNDMLMALRENEVKPLGICYPAAPVAPLVLIKSFIGFVGRHPVVGAKFAMPVVLASLAEEMPCDHILPK